MPISNKLLEIYKEKLQKRIDSIKKENEIPHICIRLNDVCRNVRYCCQDQLLDFLKEYHKEILFIELTYKHGKIPSNFFDQYCYMIRNQINNIKRNIEYKRNNKNTFGANPYYVTEYKFAGWHWHVTMNELYEEVCKHNVFAYLPIYKEIKWNFKLVEKYKDLIIWDKLMSESNLMFDLTHWVKYESYFPKGIGYYKLKAISNEYISKNKKSIEWDTLVYSAPLIWNSSDIKKYYRYAKRIGKAWSIFDLARNERFKCTPESFLTMIELDHKVLDVCISNKKYYKLLLKINGHKNIVNKFVRNKDFYNMCIDGKKMEHGEYSAIFTIENIEKNKDRWSKIIEEKYEGMNRTPDTNYHRHRLYNMWDYFIDNANIKLNYKLCKYLQSLTITIGGTYVTIDCTSYREEDNSYQRLNALEAFSKHSIVNTKELQKICSDTELLSTLLNSSKGCSDEVLDYIINISKLV